MPKYLAISKSVDNYSYYLPTELIDSCNKYIEYNYLNPSIEVLYRDDKDSILFNIKQIKGSRIKCIDRISLYKKDITLLLSSIEDSKDANIKSTNNNYKDLYYCNERKSIHIRGFFNTTTFDNMKFYILMSKIREIYNNNK